MITGQKPASIYCTVVLYCIPLAAFAFWNKAILESELYVQLWDFVNTGIIALYHYYFPRESSSNGESWNESENHFFSACSYFWTRNRAKTLAT